jgi:antirestriction protein ArdC
MEELVAEATSIIIMQHLDCLPEDLSNHADYFQYWLGHAGGRKKALRCARREAERAARYIISAKATTTKTPEHGIIPS